MKRRYRYLSTFLALLFTYSNVRLLFIHPQSVLSTQHAAQDRIQLRFVAVSITTPVEDHPIPPRPPHLIPLVSRSQAPTSSVQKTTNFSIARIAPPAATTMRSLNLTYRASNVSSNPQILPTLIGDQKVMSHDVGIKLTPTRFGKYFRNPKQSAVDDLLERFQDKMSIKHTFDLHHGIRINCVAGLWEGKVTISCGGDPPPPPPPTDGDVRLDLPPSPLVSPAPSSQAHSP